VFFNKVNFFGDDLKNFLMPSTKLSFFGKEPVMDYEKNDLRQKST